MRALICLLLGILILLSLAAAGLIWDGMKSTYQTAPECQPVSDTISGKTDNRSYPSIDWRRWKTDRQSFVGWITVPGTRINYPFVHASVEDPGYYLDHDFWGDFNYYGCIFLDSGCSPTFLSMNSILYGHNMAWDNEMFGDLERYSDERFAKKHRRVLIQTPSTKRSYTIVASTVIDGTRTDKRLAFDSYQTFQSWWRKIYRGADIRLENATPKRARILTLCTCSYHRWDNERTLVFAIPDE
ncbi:MAG: class B sortase [Eggerthellaceae bacterium]